MEDCSFGDNAANETFGETPTRQPFTVRVNLKEAIDDAITVQPAAYLSSASAMPEVSGHDNEEEDIPFNGKNCRKTVKPEPINNRRKLQASVKPMRPIGDTDEEPYEWVRSSLVDEIGEYINDNYAIMGMFQYPRKYWYGNDLEKVKWVSIRLRCIVESLLSFDRMDVRRREIIALNDALKSMSGATSFQFVPRNYPFKNEVAELQKILERVSRNAPKQVRIYLSREKKIKLIGLRFLLADFVRFEPFNNLDFNR